MSASSLKGMELKPAASTAVPYLGDKQPLLGDEEAEPSLGLPAKLPADEKVLWQGRPDAIGLAVHAFHIRLIAAYFATAAIMKFFSAAAADTIAAQDGAHLGAMILLLSGVAGIAILCVIAWAMSRAAIFTVTNKRIVFRSGVALRKYVNLPFKEITRIDLRKRVRTGDIAVMLDENKRAPFLHLWPFARPLKMRRPSPLMRALPKSEAIAAAKTLATAIKNAAPENVTLSSANDVLDTKKVEIEKGNSSINESEGMPHHSPAPSLSQAATL
ncbi:MAG: photosynthetic complex putative assembly protein PuhB [Pseudomonadota bacterium]